MFKDIFECHNRDITIGIYWVEAKDAAKCPAIHKTGPTTKNYAVQIIYSAEGEKT